MQICHSIQARKNLTPFNIRVYDSQSATLETSSYWKFVVILKQTTDRELYFM